VNIRADSAVVYEQSGRNELIGNVRFVREGQVLTAALADWFEREGRLFARGNVVLRDPTDGTELRGDTLIYLEPRFGGDSQVTVTGRRPSAVVPVEDDPTATPYEIQANRIRLQGERFFWADGAVSLDREDLKARSDSLVHDRQDGALILRIGAEVIRDDVMAMGEILNIDIREGRLQGLVARNPGRVETEDGYAVSGLEVFIELTDDGDVAALWARGGEDRETGDSFRASIQSGDLVLDADSEVRLGDVDPESGVRVLTATGAARAEATEGAFGTSANRGRAEPVSDDRLTGIPDRDWIEGETIQAFLQRVEPDDASEEGEERWELLRLRAETAAKALYRQPPDDDVTEPETSEDPAIVEIEIPEQGLPAPRRSAISYVLADLIILHMQDGSVRLLEAEGNVRGLQLDPQRESQ
jgi:lipopolysaccharide export system protein LptA